MWTSSPIIKIEEYLEKFESKATARKWEKQHIKWLCRKTGYSLETVAECSLSEAKETPRLRLARKLARRLHKRKTCSSASRVRLRWWRRWIMRQLGQIFNLDGNVWSLSLIPSDEEFQASYGKLHKVDFKKLKSRMVKKFERLMKDAGLEHVLMAGGFDISFNVETESSGNRWPSYWQLHLYILFQGCDGAIMRKAIESHFPASEKCPAPIEIKKVKPTLEDYAHVFSYSLKAIFYQRKSYRDDKTGNLRTNKDNPLKPDQLCELLVFLDRISVTDRLFFRNVRRYGKFLVRGGK